MRVACSDAWSFLVENQSMNSSAVCIHFSVRGSSVIPIAASSPGVNFARVFSKRLRISEAVWKSTLREPGAVTITFEGRKQSLNHQAASEAEKLFPSMWPEGTATYL